MMRIWVGLVGLFLAGCAPSDLKKSGGSGGEGAGSGAGDGSTTGSEVVSAERRTSGVIEFRAEPPTEGVKLPFPDAKVAVDAKELGKRGGTLTISTIGDPKTFDPITANENSSTQIINFGLFRGLVTYDYALQEFGPDLLKEMTLGEDKLTWTCRLRDGLKWSDGQPLTADDVMFTAKVVYDESIINPNRDIMQVDGKPLELAKVDDLTFTIKTAKPTGFMHVMLASLQIVPKHALEAAHNAGEYASAMNVNIDPAKLVVNGPYKLRAYQPAERVILERNPHYHVYDKAGTQLPYLDSVVFSVAPELDSMLARFTSKETDALDTMRPESVANMRDGQKAGNYTLFETGPSDQVNMFWLNQKQGNGPDGSPYVKPELQPVFADAEFRKAVYLSLNRPAMVTSVLRGLATVVHSQTTPALKDWMNPNVVKYNYNPELAKQTLEKAGYVDKDGDGIRESKEGKKLQFTFITNVENKTRVELGSIIASDLRAVGIEATVQQVEFNTLVTALNDSFKYDACLLGFGGSIHPVTSMNSWRSNGRTHFWNPLQQTPATPWEAEVDRLCNEFIAALEFEKQQEVFFEMQRIMTENVAAMPLFTMNKSQALRNTIGNARESSLVEIFWNLDELYRKQ